MNKFVKWLLIIVSSIIAFLIVATVLLYIFLPLNAIKDLAAQKLSEQLNREVKIRSVSFNIFSGIKLNGITIANGRGFAKGPMVSASSLELKYALLPLFQGKVIIPEINLVKPQILVEKDYSGNFNFSGMFSSSPKKTDKKPQKKPSASNINLIINTLRITNGKIVYNDYYTGKSEISNFNLNVSNITLAAFKPIDVKASAVINYLGDIIPIVLTTNIGVDLSDGSLKVRDLVIKVSSDTLNASADIIKNKNSTQVALTAASNGLTLDPYLALFAGGAKPSKKEKTPHGALTKSLQKTFANIPANLIVSTSFNFKNVILRNLKVDSFIANATLKNRVFALKLDDFSGYKGKLYGTASVNLPALSYNISKLELHNFNAEPFINDLVDSFFPAMIDIKKNIEGNLDVSLSAKGAGVELPEAFQNLKASGVILLSKGRLKKIKSLSSIGEKYNINMLKQDMIVSGLRINASMSDMILNVNKLSLQDTDLRVDFSGKLDFNKTQYVPGNRLRLTFNPSIAQNLPQEFSLLKDDKGAIAADFELQGALYKPFPSPVFQKSIQTVVGNLKVKIEAKKMEIEQRAKQELSKAAASAEAQAKQQLQEEAKKKIKEIFKF